MLSFFRMLGGAVCSLLAPQVRGRDGNGLDGVEHLCAQVTDYGCDKLRTVACRGPRADAAEQEAKPAVARTIAHKSGALMAD